LRPVPPTMKQVIEYRPSASTEVSYEKDTAPVNETNELQANFTPPWLVLNENLFCVVPQRGGISQSHLCFRQRQREFDGPVERCRDRNDDLFGSKHFAFLRGDRAS